MGNIFWFGHAEPAYLTPACPDRQVGRDGRLDSASHPKFHDVALSQAQGDVDLILLVSELVKTLPAAGRYAL